MMETGNPNRLLISLLSSFVKEDYSEISGPVDVFALMKLAKIHNAEGIAAYALLQSKNDLSDRQKMYLEKKTVNAFSHMVMKNEQMKAFDAILRENHIDYVPFKGYVIKDYYPVPALRTSGDVDLLIRKEDRERCHKALKKDFEVKTDWEPVYTYTRSVSVFEVHTELLDTDISRDMKCRDYFRDHLAENIIQTGDTYSFRKEFHFAYLITHIAKHVSGSGAGIRMYMDLALMIRREPDMDWELVRTILSDAGLTHFADCALSLVNACFDTEIPFAIRMMKPEDLDAFIAYTMEAGVFGYRNRDAGAVEMSSHRKNTANSRGQQIVRRLFPSAETIAPRYTYLQKHKWLLPAAWVHRLVKTAGTAGKHLDEAKNIVNADSEEIKRLNHIHDILGV